MTLLHSMRLAVRRLGLDLMRYNPAVSSAARARMLLHVHGIELVIDVGAADGEFALDLRGAGYRGRIISFEPVTQQHELLQRNAASDPMWTIAQQMAVGDVDGEVEINIAGNSRSSSVLEMLSSHQEAAPESRYIAKETVPIRRLDSLDVELGLTRSRALLKVDTQGFEMQVLRGATQILDRLIGLRLELSLLPLYAGQVLYLDMIEFLAQRGFGLYGIDPGFIDQRTGRLLQFDGTFFRAP